MSDNGIIKGQLHSECTPDKGCGVKMTVDKQKNIEAERDEAIITPKAFSDNKQYSVVGTPMQAASAVNVMGGGKSFEKGAVIYDSKGKQVKEVTHVSKNNEVKDGADLPSGSVIINRTNLTRDNKRYEFKGSMKQIASEINTLNGNGVVVELGGEAKTVYEKGGMVKSLGDRAGFTIIIRDELLNTNNIIVEKPARSWSKQQAAKLDFPKGHIEADEKPFKAANREMEEEIGIILPKHLQKRAKKNHYKFVLNRNGDVMNQYVLILNTKEFDKYLSKYFKNKIIKKKYIQEKEVNSAFLLNLEVAEKPVKKGLQPAFKNIKEVLDKEVYPTPNYRIFVSDVKALSSDRPLVSQIKSKKYKKLVYDMASLSKFSGASNSDLIDYFHSKGITEIINSELSNKKLEMKLKEINKSNPNKFEDGGEAVAEPKEVTTPPKPISELKTEARDFDDEAINLMNDCHNYIKKVLIDGRKKLRNKDLDARLDSKEVLSSNHYFKSLGDAINHLYQDFVSEVPSRYLTTYIELVESYLSPSNKYYVRLKHYVAMKSSDSVQPVNERYTDNLLSYLPPSSIVKKKVKALHYSQESLSKIMSNFVGDDELRETMRHVVKNQDQIYYNDESSHELAATNAHVLIVLRDRKYTGLLPERGRYNIVHGVKDFKRLSKGIDMIPKRHKQKETLDYHFKNNLSESSTDRQKMGYPMYERVIPSDNDMESVEIDCAVILNLLETLSSGGYLNPTTKASYFSVSGMPVDYEMIGFNAVFMIQAMKSAIMLGHKKARFLVNRFDNKRAMMIKPLNPNDDSFEILIMPVMIYSNDEARYYYDVSLGQFVTVNKKYIDKSLNIVSKSFRLSKEKTDKILKN